MDSAGAVSLVISDHSIKKHAPVPIVLRPVLAPVNAARPGGCRHGRVVDDCHIALVLPAKDGDIAPLCLCLCLSLCTDLFNARLSCGRGRRLARRWLCCACVVVRRLQCA